jgi:hypothetical protein
MPKRLALRPPTRVRLAVCAAVLALSACASTAAGEARGQAHADLYALADQVTLDALQCAHVAGDKDAHITQDGGIVGGSKENPDVVSDCFAKVLDQPEYAAFDDQSESMMRTTYDGFVVIHQCLLREGFLAGGEPPTFGEWMGSGRSWSPYGALVEAEGVAQLESASKKCDS